LLNVRGTMNFAKVGGRCGVRRNVITKSGLNHVSFASFAVYTSLKTNRQIDRFLSYREVAF